MGRPPWELEELTKMETGLLERILIRRYGRAVRRRKEGMEAQCWNQETPDEKSVLYMGMNWNSRLGRRFASLRDIYGNSFGGFLVGDSIKVAMLLPRKIWGLRRVDELQFLLPIRKALETDPEVEFFMDASNVWYYGHKAGELWVFDSETDELDSLGPVEPALDRLIEQWEAAGAPYN